MPPTLSEMFIGDIQKANQPESQGEVAAGWNAAANIAQLQQTRQSQAAQLRQKQQELEAAKWDKVGNWLEAYSKMPDGGGKQAFAKTFIPTGIQALGMQDKIDPTVLQAMLKDSQYATGVIGMIRDGRLTPTDLLNGEKMMQVYPEAAQEAASIATSKGEDVAKAYNQRLNDEASVKAAGMRAGGTQDRFDTKLKTQLVDKVNALGIPDIKVSLNDLNGAIPGGMDGYKKGTPIPGISGGEAALPTNRLSGQALQVRQAAQSVGNQILKLRSGAAVTDGEAMRTLAELGMVPTIGEGGTWTGLTWKGTTSPEAFVNGMKRSRNIVAAKEKTFRNAYGADMYDTVIGSPVGVGNGETGGSPGAKTAQLQGRSFDANGLKNIIKATKNAALKKEAEQALKQLEGG